MICSRDTIAASKTTSWDTTIRPPATNGNGNTSSP